MSVAFDSWGDRNSKAAITIVSVGVGDLHVLNPNGGSMSTLTIDSTPVIEVHIGQSSLSAAAGSTKNTKLSNAQIQEIQSFIANLIQGFQPKLQEVKHGEMQLSSVQVSIGFKLEFESSEMIKLILNAKSEATISATCEWSRAT